MAKAKLQELSMEEKLEQALVPDEEQPYIIPENWAWVKFGSLAMDMADGPFGSNLKREHYTDKKEVRIIQLSNIGENGWRDENTKYTTFEHVKTISRSKVKPGEIVIAKMMPAGRAIKVPDEEKAYVLSSDAVKFVPKNPLDTDYLLNAINSRTFRNQVSSETQGITRARTSIGKLKTYAFPLAPLAEQQRIVNCIERLLSELNRAKELAQNALDSFETRKAAILHKAFTGELTAKWREENGVGMDSWEEIRLGELLKPMVTKRPDNDKQTFRYIDIDAIDNKTQTVREPKTTLVSEAPSRSSRSIEAGNVVFSLVRPYLKNIAYIPEELSDCIASTGFYVCRCKPQLDSMFLYNLLCSQDTINYFTSYMKGDNSPSIRKDDFEGLMVNLPSMPEQQEIVHILGELLEKEEKAKEICDVIDKIDLMKKAILARAFRGELGTNDTSEESAIELLKDVLIYKE